MADEILVRDPNSVPGIGAANADSSKDAMNIYGDEDKHTLRVGCWIWNPSTFFWERMRQPTIEAGDLYIALDEVENLLQAAPVARSNPAFSMAYNADGTPNYIDMIVQGLTYRKTFTWVAGQVTVESAWVQQ